MRHVAALTLGLGLALATTSLARAEYFCSPGFEPSYGGTCVAVASRAEIELYLDQPLYDETTTVVHHRRHRRHGLRERF